MKSSNGMVLVAAATLVLALTACGGDDTAESDSGGADGETVVVEGFAFDPDQLEVSTGTTVVCRPRSRPDAEPGQPSGGLVSPNLS